MAVTSAGDLPTNIHQHVAFVSVSPVRGTMELVWGCVFTIILCTWNILHLTIASPHKPTWRVVARKLKWAFATIIAPEYISMQAVTEYFAARTETQQIQNAGLRWWTMKHSFFGNMGGYLLEYQNEGRIIIESAAIEWLAAEQLLVLPEIECSEIDALASEGTFQKAITAVQLVWFAFQCIGRAIKGMKFALFEVTTLCFITCAIVTMFFWWEKPSGVSTRKKIICPSISDQDIDRILESTNGEKHSQMQDLHLPNDMNIDSANGVWMYMLFLLAGGLGAWHLAAWNYSFPTTAESILWRVSSIVTIATPTMILLDLEEALEDFNFALSRILMIFLVSAYVAARMFLLVETVISLRSAPAGIYRRVIWSDFVPHF